MMPCSAHPHWMSAEHPCPPVKWSTAFSGFGDINMSIMRTMLSQGYRKVMPVTWRKNMTPTLSNLESWAFPQ